MEHLFEGFRLVDAGSLIFLVTAAFWWLRQINKGTWHSEREVLQLISLYEKHIKAAEADRDERVAKAEQRELEWRGIAQTATEAANIMQSQLTSVVGELKTVGRVMHAINPSIQQEDTDAQVER